MIELTEDVHLIPLFPRYGVNAYLVGTVLIDAGVRSSRKKLLKALLGKELTAHALTHAHPDHQGASAAVCRERFVPYWCGEADVEAAESGQVTGTMPNPEGLIARTLNKLWSGPGCPVDRALREGDEVAGFQVLETPGHTPGHVAYWRESDRVLILGDVLNNMSLLTTIPGLQEPPGAFTQDPQENRRSIQRLAALEPELTCFGHGPPLRGSEKLVAFAAGLGDSRS